MKFKVGDVLKYRDYKEEECDMEYTWAFHIDKDGDAMVCPLIHGEEQGWDYAVTSHNKFWSKPRKYNQKSKT